MANETYKNGVQDAKIEALEDQTRKLFERTDMLMDFKAQAEGFISQGKEAVAEFRALQKRVYWFIGIMTAVVFAIKYIL